MGKPRFGGEAVADGDKRGSRRGDGEERQETGMWGGSRSTSRSKGEQWGEKKEEWRRNRGTGEGRRVKE